MLTPQQLLVDGEKLLGSYNVEIARWNHSKWVSTVPPLFATLTDQRVILQAHSRKRLEPAIIPARYLSRVTETSADHRHIISLHLKTGHHISMFIAGNLCDEIMDHLRAMLLKRSPVRFTTELDIAALQKMIELFERMA